MDDMVSGLSMIMKKCVSSMSCSSGGGNIAVSLSAGSSVVCVESVMGARDQSF